MTNASDPTQDPRPLFAKALEIATPIINAVTADQYGLPTPCPDYDVQGLFGHLLFALDRVGSLPTGHAADSDETTIASTDWSADWLSTTEATLQAWADDALLAKVVVLPWATMTGAEALGTYTSEITNHTWDLAHATGQTVQWDDDVCRLSLASMQRELPMADRTPMWAGFLAHAPADFVFAAPFANAVTVPDDASLIDQLLAWCGRKPRASVGFVGSVGSAADA